VRRCAGVHFVLVMGADNLGVFIPLQNWRATSRSDADGGGGTAWIEPLRATGGPPGAQALARTACRSAMQGLSEHDAPACSISRFEIPLSSNRAPTTPERIMKGLNRL